MSQSSPPSPQLTRDTYAELMAQVGLKEYALVLLMLKANISPNREDNSKGGNDVKDSCLHVAARNGDANMVELLLRYKADPTKKGKDGKTPPQITAEKGDWRTFKHYCANKDAQFSHAMLKLAVKAREVDVVEALLMRDVSPNAEGNEDSCLHLAVTDRELDRTTKRIVTLLLDHGADLTKQNSSQKTPIQCAVNEVAEFIISLRRADVADAMHVGSKLLDAVNAKDIKLAKKFLIAGASLNWNYLSKTNSYLLHVAVDNRDVEMIKLLRRYGVSLELKKEKGVKVIDYAEQQQAWDCLLALQELMPTGEKIFNYLTKGVSFAGQDKVKNINEFAEDYKEAVFVQMMRIPDDKERMAALEQALNKDTGPGAFFWHQRGLITFPDTWFTPSKLLPSLEHGMLKVISDELALLRAKLGVEVNLERGAVELVL